jgi:hypothetical protein
MAAEDEVRRWLDTLPKIAEREAYARLTRLAKRLSERRVQFLFGAGMSAGSGLPLAAQLATRLLHELVSGASSSPTDVELRIVATYPLDAIAQTYRDQTDEASLADIVTEIYRDTPATLHEGHTALQFLADQKLLNKVYTTNFDRLLEAAFSTRGETVTDQNIDDLHGFLVKNQVSVLHLHGAAGADPRIIESETFELNTPLAMMLAADMTTHWFAWVGYSLSDGNLRALFYATTKLLSQYKRVKRPDVIYPLSASDPELEWSLADALWTARKCSYIPGGAEVVLPALARLVIQSEGEALAERIVTARGGDAKDPKQIQAIWDDASEYKHSRLGGDLEAIRVLAEQHGVGK